MHSYIMIKNNDNDNNDKNNPQHKDFNNKK